MSMNAIRDAIARYQLGNNAAPSAPQIANARTSTALLSFAKRERDNDVSEFQSIGSVLVRLHSDLVPLGVQNFVSNVHRGDGGYCGSSIRMMENGIALECGDITEITATATASAADGNQNNHAGAEESTEWRTLREPYWRWGSNQHQFKHNARGLLSWMGGNNDRSNEKEGSKFLITLKEDATDLDAQNLVFGTIDLYDIESAETFQNIMLALKDGSPVQISDCRLVSYQFKDLLDGTYSGRDVNWKGVRSLFRLLHSHSVYEKMTSWVVGNNSHRSNERNILQALLYQNAPVDLLSEAVSICTGSQVIAPDPRGEDLPLLRAYKRAAGTYIVSQIMAKMDELPDETALGAYKKVFTGLCFSSIGMNDLLVLLGKIQCDRKSILQQLEGVVNGWRLVRLEDESLETWWREDDTDIKSTEGFSDIWSKTCCLLYAIEFHEILSYDNNRKGFSPLCTLFRLGQMNPHYKELYRGEMYLSHDRPDLPADSEYSNSFAFSVLRMLEFVGGNFPDMLSLRDSNKKQPLHEVATAFYTYHEQDEYPYEDFVSDFDGINMNSGFGLRAGERILSYLLENVGPQQTLEKDASGETVLSLLLKETLRRPLVRIQLVLEAVPELCGVKGSSGLLPFYDALDLPEDIGEEGSVMEQLYINCCFISAHLRLGLAFDTSNEDVLNRFCQSINCEDSGTSRSKRTIGEFQHNTPIAAMAQANRLLTFMGPTEAFGQSFFETLMHFLGKMCNEFDQFPEHLNEDRLKDSLKSLLATSAGHHVDNLQLSFFVEHAFEIPDDFSFDYNLDEDSGKARFFQDYLLKGLLEMRQEYCYEDVVSFMQHSIPYYKAMASWYHNTIAETEAQEWQSWRIKTKEERIAELHEDLKRVAAKGDPFLKLFLAGRLEGLGPLLHQALALASGDDGIALSILRIDPKAAQVEYEEKLPLYSAIENGCDNRIALSILRSYPKAAQVVYQKKLPLHSAIEKGCDMVVIEELLSAYPKSLLKREGESSLYPFQLAAATEASLDVVYLLLRKQPNQIEG